MEFTPAFSSAVVEVDGLRSGGTQDPSPAAEALAKTSDQPDWLIPFVMIGVMARVSAALTANDLGPALER